MSREKITTKELAQILGMTPSGVHWSVKHRLGFPEPERLRKGTVFYFLLKEVIDYLVVSKITSRVSFSNLLRVVALPPTRTTTEVLQMMKRKPSKGNRADLARFVREKRLPEPFLRCVGRGGENLWLAEVIDPVMAMGWLNWQKSVKPLIQAKQSEGSLERSFASAYVSNA